MSKAPSRQERDGERLLGDCCQELDHSVNDFLGIRSIGDLTWRVGWAYNTTKRIQKMTYWNHNGTHQALANEIKKLVPQSGPAGTPSAELFRHATNMYYDIYNNGGGNLVWSRRDAVDAMAELKRVTGFELSKDGLRAVEMIRAALDEADEITDSGEYDNDDCDDESPGSVLTGLCQWSVFRECYEALMDDVVLYAAGANVQRLQSNF